MGRSAGVRVSCLTGVGRGLPSVWQCSCVCSVASWNLISVDVHSSQPRSAARIVTLYLERDCTHRVSLHRESSRSDWQQPEQYGHAVLVRFEV